MMILQWYKLPWDWERIRKSFYSRHLSCINEPLSSYCQVFAVARYIEPDSRWGSVVVIFTHVGELTLDGEAMHFHETLQGAFSRAGLQVDVNGRRLLGIVEIIGKQPSETVP